MDNKYQKLVSDTSNQVITSQVNSTSKSQHQQLKKQDKLLRQDKNENINLQRETSTTETSTTETSPPSPSKPSKVTMTLPEHAASRLRDLVQRKDIALIRLGIISVQFEDDQIMPLTPNTNVSRESHQPKQQQIVAPPPEPIAESPIAACNTDYFGDLNTITTLFDLASADSPIYEDSSMNAFESPILESSIANGLPERLEI